MLKFDLEANRERGNPYYGGYGDSVTLSYLYWGARGTDYPIELASGDHKRIEMMKILGVECTTDKTQAVWPSPAYNKEMDEGGTRNRIEYLQETFRIRTPALRPQKINIPEDAMQWAKEHRRAWGWTDHKTVLLFPQTHWGVRRWANNLWIDLCHELGNRGYVCRIFLEKPEDDICGNVERNIPRRAHFYFGESIPRVAAMMMLADVVVGNDSFPAHFASALGRKTIALMGPTRGTCVFGHCLDLVSCLYTEADLFCTGCHFKQNKGFRSSCDIACAALQHLPVSQVVKEIDRLTSKEPEPEVVSLGVPDVPEPEPEPELIQLRPSTSFVLAEPVGVGVGGPITPDDGEGPIHWMAAAMAKPVPVEPQKPKPVPCSPCEERRKAEEAARAAAEAAKEPRESSLDKSLREFFGSRG